MKTSNFNNISKELNEKIIIKGIAFGLQKYRTTNLTYKQMKEFADKLVEYTNEVFTQNGIKSNLCKTYTKKQYETFVYDYVENNVWNFFYTSQN